MEEQIQNNNKDFINKGLLKDLKESQTTNILYREYKIVIHKVYNEFWFMGYTIKDNNKRFYRKPNKAITEYLTKLINEIKGLK